MKIVSGKFFNDIEGLHISLSNKDLLKLWWKKAQIDIEGRYTDGRGILINIANTPNLKEEMLDDGRWSAIWRM